MLGFCLSFVSPQLFYLVDEAIARVSKHVRKRDCTANGPGSKGSSASTVVRGDYLGSHGVCVTKSEHQCCGVPALKRHRKQSQCLFDLPHASSAHMIRGYRSGSREESGRGEQTHQKVCLGRRVWGWSIEGNAAENGQLSRNGGESLRGRQR